MESFKIWALHASPKLSFLLACMLCMIEQSSHDDLILLTKHLNLYYPNRKRIQLFNNSEFKFNKVNNNISINFDPVNECFALMQ
jgi:hypothetical protein